ncbi:MAG: extracellular solute-binding protein [Candidatus Paceibacterota bacterium]
MSDPLPKPTSPILKTGNQAKTDSSSQTIFKAGLPVDPTKNSAPSPSPAAISKAPKTNEPVTPVQPIQPAATPQPIQTPNQQIQLGGRNIPVPQKPVMSSVPTPTPISTPTPTPISAPTNQTNINPALAPKPAAPLTPPIADSQPSETKQAPVFAGKKPPSDKSIIKKPFIAQAKEKPLKWVLIGLGSLLGLGLLIFVISRLLGGKSTPVQPESQTTAPVKQTVLTYWGLWEPTAVLEEIINNYEQANPGVKIDYRVQSHKDYRERLQTAIASGNGPDIFRYHASWVPMLAQDLAVLPASIMTAQEFQNTFYPAAAQQLQLGGKIVGLPIMYDGLVLYYNTQVLRTAGVEAPGTWSEIRQLANELTVPANKTERSNNGIQRAGLAIGNASNVDHFSDILALLILQNGGDLAEPAFNEVSGALKFYTNFVKEDLVWDDSLPNSTVAFARGDVAMMFAPSWRAHEIKALNPQLEFATAPLPQLSEEVVAWANYWAEGVNEKSANKTVAWNFLKYLTSAEVMQKLYSAQSQVRAFGEPYSRKDLAVSLQDDPYVGAVLQDAPIAIGWYMSSATHDNGINDHIIEYYRTAVNAVLAGNDMDEVLLSLEKGVKQELRQYGF